MSIFGKKTTREEVDSRSLIVSTGGKIDDIVFALVNSFDDGDVGVKKAIAESLRDVGRQKPELVLSTCLHFVRKEGKRKSHVILLLVTIQQLLENELYNISEHLGVELVAMALTEMTKEKSVEPEIQGPASQILTTLAKRFPHPVWSKLTDFFQPGKIPHYFIIKTMADACLVNYMEIVPFLKEIMARSLPVLGQIKKDNLRWAFSFAFSAWTESIASYLANIESASDQNITAQTFSSEVYPAYEMIISSWINNSESKVRLATVQAIGNMSVIMQREQFEQQVTTRILPAISGLYKKEKSSFPITQALSQVLSVAVKDGSTCLEPILAGVLNLLHPLACKPEVAPAADQIGIQQKNQNEILRCFEILTSSFADPVCTYLLARLDVQKVKSPQIREATLLILKHLITRCDDKLIEKKDAILSGIRPLLDNETALEVKKVLVHITITMGSQGYLHLEGGYHFIHFVLKQSAITNEEIALFDEKAKKNKVTPEITPAKLRNMADNVLNLMSTTVAGMDQILWPYLLEFLVPAQYTSAVAIICRCMANIAAPKRESEASDYLLDFVRMPNLPKPTQIVARLLVMLNEPLARGELGTRILNLLQAIGPIIHPAVTRMWDTAMPKLITFIQNNAGSDNWDSSTWEDLTLRLLSETLKIVNDEEWTKELGDELTKQFASYKGYGTLKKAALKYVGLILQKMTHREFIQQKLEMLFHGAEHELELERHGCAQAFGFCSASHLDIVLDKIKELLTGKSAASALAVGADKKKGSGFFSIFSGDSSSSSSSSPLGQKQKNTIFLCVGYVTAYASPKLVLSRLDSHILHTLEPFLANLKSADVMENIIKAIDLIAKALHPSHLGEAFRFKNRDSFIEVLIKFMTLSKDATDQTRVLGLNAASTLIHLDPPLPEALQQKFIESVIKFVYEKPDLVQQLQQAQASASNPPSSAQQKTIQELGPLIKQQQLVEDNFNEALSSMLFMETTTATLNKLFRTIIEKYLSSPIAIQRRRSVQTILALLKRFIEYKSSDQGPKTEVKYTSMGLLIGSLIPRITDPDTEVRLVSSEALEMILFIDHMLKSSVELAPDQPYSLAPPDQLATLTALREKLITPHLNEQFIISHKISAILSPFITSTPHPSSQASAPSSSGSSSSSGNAVSIQANSYTTNDLLDLVMTMIQGLGDQQPSSSSGTCVYLNTILKLRGGDELQTNVSQIVLGLLGALAKINDDKTQNGSLHSIRTLANHHLLLVLEELLKQPIPHSIIVVKSLQILAKDPNLITQIIDHFTDILNNSQVVDESGGNAGQKGSNQINAGFQTPLPRAMSTTLALGELFELDELETVVNENFAQIFSTLLLRIGTTRFSKDGGASDQIYQTFKKFVTCLKDTEFDTVLSSPSFQQQFKSNDQYFRAVIQIVAYISKTHSAHFNAIYDFILPYLQGNFLGQRVVTAALFCEMISHCSDNRDLLQYLINNILSIMVDEKLKLITLIGLGNVAHTGPETTNLFAPTVIDALMCSIDAPDEVLAMEAMNGLTKIFNVVHENCVAPILVNICHRIRPAFEKKNVMIRSASYELFGSLHRFGFSAASSNFFDQIHNNLPMLYLHLNEEQPDVVRACKRALKLFGPLLHAPDLADFFNEALDEDRHLNIQDFLNQLSALLVRYFPERLNYYVMNTCDFFKSDWITIRVAAASFVGYAMGNIPPDRRYTIGVNPSLVTNAIIPLLKQDSPEVRTAAANAMSFMYGF